MIFEPFRAWRARADLAARIASVPYDVVDTEQARALARGNPHSFLHVIRPEIDLDPAIAPDDDRVYARGRENLAAMIERGWLVRDEQPAFFLYRLSVGEHRQTGVLGLVSVDEYLENRIRRHEHTRPDKETDRVRLNEALAANPGPVWMAHRAHPGIDELVRLTVSDPPQVRFTAVDGVEHELWVLGDPGRCSALRSEFETLPRLYIADGHHRAAAAVRVALGLRERLEAPTGREPCHYFLAALFPAQELRILGYHRLVRDLGGRKPEDWIRRVKAAGFEIRDMQTPGVPARRGAFGLYLGGRWRELVAPAAARSVPDVALRLDVSILAERILEPLLGIGDPRTDPRIDFVGGGHGPAELERRVDSGTAAAAFALHPTSLEEVMQVADEGRVMPPKSTWFEPKLRSGLVVQTLKGDSL